MTYHTDNEQTLEGIIERITFHSEETGYTVAKLKVRKERELITAVGEMAAIYVGEEIRLKGSWSTHPRFGSQFKARTYQKLLPATAVGLQKYLGSGLIKGIGPITARRLVEAFGTDIIDVIESAPERLLDVPKIGPKKKAIIVNGWQEQKEIQNVMLFLQSHGVSTTYAVKIYKKYGDQAITVVEENPYRLAEDIWGIGFKTADAIAEHLGYAADSPERLKAGILYALNRITDNGHVYFPEDKLVNMAAELLEVSVDKLGGMVQMLGQESQVHLEGDPQNPHVYLISMYRAERGGSNQLKQLLHTPAAIVEKKIPPLLHTIEGQNQIQLSDEQRSAVLAAVVNKVMVLTGGPGTGKTTVSQTIIRLFEALGLKVMLASPTGRAAKRLSEVTSREAKTIHRLLKFDPKTFGFRHHENNPLELDVLLLDEVSMIDVVLFNSLLKALPPQTRLILVGDSDQLPSVGPGAVLKDLINSGVIPVAHLTTIFRQAQASMIVMNAHRINRGEFPVLLEPSGKNRQENAFFILAEEPEAIAERILELVTERLPRAGYTADDIQILCPMNRGVIGAHHLNLALQQSLNPSQPSKPEVNRGQRNFRLNDRVIQLRNNYDHSVFNGDMGIISALDSENQTMSVAYPEDTVTYDFSELDELALAYALSVHKSQGSEYPVVIMPVSTQHYMMLQRNLLYTAITRARRLLILVGTKKALAIAVKNNKIQERYSGLSERIKSQ